MVHLLVGRKLYLSFIPSFILQVKFIKIVIEYITFGLMMERVLPKHGRLKLLMLKCPIQELPSNIVIDNFYARLALHDKDYLDASYFGSFTHMKGEAKWDILDRIQENAEGWENNKGRRSGINYDYECIKTFMGTDDFHNVSTAYGLDS
jgi:hypothetical protein